MQTQTHPGTPNTAPAKTARFKPPYFRAHATVQVFLPGTSETSYSPDASLRVTFYLAHRDDEYTGGKNAAQGVLLRLGADAAKVEQAHFEVFVDDYVACDARYVRNPDRDPIKAYSQPHAKDEARLLRQRRIVPQSHREMFAMYGPKPATTEGAAA